MAFLAPCVVLPVGSARATSSALVVTGLSGSAENAEEFQRLAAATKAGLVRRGVPADRVAVVDGAATTADGTAARDGILAKLAEAALMERGDEFWLVLLGHSGRAADGAPAFQIRGPRLTATDLKAALAAIPARQFVFIGTDDAGDYLPVLRDARRSVLAATASGEASQPRLPAAWVEALAAHPAADFRAIAAEAAAATAREYERSQLAQLEHSRLADPADGQILEPPFGTDAISARTDPASSAEVPSPLPTASDIDVKITNPNAEWERQPATAATREIVAAAKAAPNPDGYAALVLEQRIRFTVEDDRTTDRAVFYRVFLARDEAVEEWANYFLPQNPPMVTSKLEIARVIQPDGSVTAFNPAKLPGATDPTSGTCCAMAMVYLPGARAGCVVEIGFRTRQMLNATLPHVSEYFPVQQSAPVLATNLEVRVPEKPRFRVVMNNGTAAPDVSSENGRAVYRWKLGPLAAAESLPGDPPARLWETAIGVSSLPSWDDFAAWYRRLAQGSDKADDAVRKTADELAEGASSRMERIRRAFEFVSALRYVAIEIGVQGFRPRTPGEVLSNRYGDCKDKANLLVALLRCRQIDARFVLLNRGSATDVNFPSWQFNHAICMVPAAPGEGQPEDLWLDATDSVTPFGFVPPGDYGRAGLVFSKDKAAFQTITTGAAAVSERRDEWDLAQTPEGGWTGTFRRHATGLADDTIRRAFRGLAPAQRRAMIYQLLAGLWPAADFAKGRVSDMSALGADAELAATLTAPAGELPRLDAPGFDAFSSPERDRPLWLNDAQPLVLTQSIRMHYSSAAPAALPEPWTAEVAGQKLRVAWEKIDDRTVRRVARVELAKPIVATADYAALRQAIRGWNVAMSRTEEKSP